MSAVDVGAQLVIAACGALAVWLSQAASERQRRWACVVGLLAQPAWVWAAFTSGQWGVLAATVFYTLAWARGAWVYWGRPRALRGRR